MQGVAHGAKKYGNKMINKGFWDLLMWYSTGSITSTKPRTFLGQKDAYRPLTTGPTNKHKSKLINILRTIKAEGALGDTTNRKLYPTDAAILWATQHHKKSPLRSAVSSRGAVTYGVAKELANILRLTSYQLHCGQPVH